ncbi:hypothetical protein [Paenibacillus sp. CAA11]|uniref:hypothetical protein n=1 Tax=Paenibacillus sp. CAA11 TaxID=1532905 RepID=UPI001F18BC88|nr:hypothetical protein [Paenibacillus sp. CAA11]
MSDMEQQDKELERQLSELLTDGELNEENRQEEGRKRLSPKYEIRIQTELDPIVTETRKYRSMAKEIDNRYDKYMDRLPKEQQK